MLARNLPLGEETVVGQVTGRVQLLVVIAVLGLNGVRSEQHRRFGWAVNVVRQDGVLHLQVEETYRYVLNQLLGDVFRVEFGSELELQWTLLLDILIQHLLQKKKTFNNFEIINTNYAKPN